MREEAVPKLDRAGWIDRAQASNGVVFCQFHCWLRGVDLVIVGFNELDIRPLLLKVLFYREGAFIVEYVERWVVSFRIEFVVAALESFYHFGFFSAFHWSQ